MDHACLNRVNGYLESNDVYRSNRIGSRRGISTQDAIIQLKGQVIDTTGRGLRAILGLVLKKAFDRIEHAAILERIAQLALGERTYNYIRNFLTGRTARIRLDDEESIQVDIGSAGTLQGSVVSPMFPTSS
ncbi:uncharacterized protein LOC119454179 [Dermacentor silvarum]|uniref:uncharacterized protein LOC119454179 n=1 Tax=Dermacentor silvarum TaxID=543639 RepID=UPI0018983EC6|nr:uncharacterized protein LOC119454179 [Dermacentor silvarum]